MLGLQLTVAAAGRILILSSQAQAPVGPPAPTLPVIADSKYLRLFLDGEFVSTTSDNRVFSDSSLNNFTITNSGRQLLQNSFHPYGDTSAWSIDARTSRLRVGTSASSFAFMHNTAAKFTFECWIFPRGLDGLLVDTRGGADTGKGVTIEIVSGGLLRLSISNGTGVGSSNLRVAQVATTSSLSYRWQHIAVTYDQSLDSGNAKIYIDGNLNASSNKLAPAPFAGDSSNILTVLSNSQSSAAGDCINAYVSNMRITNDIVYSTTTSFTPPTQGLTATSATQLLTFQDGWIKDNSQNAFTFTSLDVALTPENFGMFRNNPFGAPLTTSSSVGSVRFNDVTTEGLITPANSAFIFGTDDFTIESWIYPATIAGEDTIFGVTPAAAATKALLLSLATGKLQFFDRTNYTVATGAVPIHQWSHVAAVRNSGTLTLYVNGRAEVTATNTTNFDSSTQYFIGHNGSQVSRFHGHISDLRVMKGVAAYTASFAPPVEPLTAISGTSLLLKFNNGAVIDKAGQALPVYLAHTSTTATGISSLVVKNGNSSLYFPGGASDYVIVDKQQFLGERLMWNTYSDFTIEFWVNFQEFRSGPLFSTGAWSPETTDVMLIHANTTTNRINLYIAGINRVWNITSATAILSSAPTLNTWYHLAVTRNGNTYRTFADGTQVSTFSTSTVIYVSSQSTFIGGNFKGYIDDFRIYQGFAKYTSNFTPE